MQNNDLIIVTARISMKKTEEGGRKSGIASGYRPNHVFEMPEDLKWLTAFPGDIRLDDQESIEPGETKIVTVRFIRMPPMEKYMKVGQKWFINEGPTTVGFGEILEVHS